MLRFFRSLWRERERFLKPSSSPAPSLAQLWLTEVGGGTLNSRPASLRQGRTIKGTLRRLPRPPLSTRRGVARGSAVAAGTVASRPGARCPLRRCLGTGSSGKSAQRGAAPGPRSLRADTSGCGGRGHPGGGCGQAPDPHLGRRLGPRGPQGQVPKRLRSARASRGAAAGRRWDPRPRRGPVLVGPAQGC